MFLFSCSFFLLFQFFHSAGNDLFKIQLAGKLRLKPYSLQLDDDVTFLRYVIENQVGEEREHSQINQVSFMSFRKKKLIKPDRNMQIALQ